MNFLKVLHPRLEENRVFQGAHEGRRCFILATGPSVKKQDLRPLEGEICISVSNFFVHPDYLLIRPAYHCMAPFHPPMTEAGWRDWVSELGRRSGEAIVFFGSEDRQRIERHGLLSAERVRTMQFGASEKELLAGGVDLARPVLAPQSVTVMALQLAIYMECNPIYLVGCDHDWLAHVGTSAHFYEEREHALVRSGYDEWAGYDVRNQHESQGALWRQYKLLERVGELHSARIFNATPGSFLDVFGHVRLESLVDKAPRP